MTVPKVFILDVDGVMTDGTFYYTENGKTMKKFGADDADALQLLLPYMEVRFVSGDKRGFAISRKRIADDMKMQIDCVSTFKRIDWISERYNPDDAIYMGDGIFDPFVMKKVGYAIATANADKTAKECAHYVTERCGGDRAVAEACLHILDKFFVPFNLEDADKIHNTGVWSV